MQAVQQRFWRLVTFAFPFELNGLWSRWQYSFCLWTERNFVWLQNKRKIVNTIIFCWTWKEPTSISAGCEKNAEHAEKSFLNLVKLNQISIVITLFWGPVLETDMQTRPSLPSIYCWICKKLIWRICQKFAKTEKDAQCSKTCLGKSFFRALFRSLNNPWTRWLEFSITKHLEIGGGAPARKRGVYGKNTKKKCLKIFDEYFFLLRLLDEKFFHTFQNNIREKMQTFFFI